MWLAVRVAHTISRAKRAGLIEGGVAKVERSWIKAISRAKRAGLIEGFNGLYRVNKSGKFPAQNARASLKDQRTHYNHHVGALISRAKRAGLIEGSYLRLRPSASSKFPAQNARASLKELALVGKLRRERQFPAQNARASLKGQRLRQLQHWQRKFPAQNARASLKGTGAWRSGNSCANFPRKTRGPH